MGTDAELTPYFVARRNPPAGVTRKRRHHRAAYVAASLTAVATYPILPHAARPAVALLVAAACLVPVVRGLRRVVAADRRPWWILLAALLTHTAGIVVGIVTALCRLAGSTGAGAGPVLTDLAHTGANVLALAAVLALALRRCRNDLGGLIDVTIVSVAASGVMWALLMHPHLKPPMHPALDAARLRTTTEVSTFVTIFALGAALGAAGHLLRTAEGCDHPLRLLVGGVGLILGANLLLAPRLGGATGDATGTASAVLTMLGYLALGLFALDAAATDLVRPGPAPRDTPPTIGRLVLLGSALAMPPVVLGGQEVSHSLGSLLLAIDGALIAALVTVRSGRSAAENAHAQRVLLHRATHDPLTGLPNRVEFTSRLTAELCGTRGCLVLFCDLDGFKAVNDRLGHAAGDLLLTEVARRLRECVRENDTVSRFGGDEFLVLYREAGATDAAALSARIHEALGRPVVLGAATVTASASIGSVVATPGLTAQQLIEQADQAMYAAKQLRRRRSHGGLVNSVRQASNTAWTVRDIDTPRWSPTC